MRTNNERPWWEDFDNIVGLVFIIFVLAFVFFS